jgi:hypothetical protein
LGLGAHVALEVRSVVGRRFRDANHPRIVPADGLAVSESCLKLTRLKLSDRESRGYEALKVVERTFYLCGCLLIPQRKAEIHE